MEYQFLDQSRINSANYHPIINSANYQTSINSSSYQPNINSSNYHTILNSINFLLLPKLGEEPNNFIIIDHYGCDHMPVKFGELDPKMQRLLSLYPVRGRVKWEDDDGQVVLIYPKNFTKFEEWLHKKISGPDMIRRPLDEIGSKIWLMCDGKHDISSICTELDDQYHEDVEPVLDRVVKFLETLLSLNLVRLSTKREYRKKKRALKKKEK